MPMQTLNRTPHIDGGLGRFAGAARTLARNISIATVKKKLSICSRRATLPYNRPHAKNHLFIAPILSRLSLARLLAAEQRMGSRLDGNEL